MTRVKAHDPDHLRPHLGVLLEQARRRLFDEVRSRPEASAYADVQNAHITLLVFLPEGGARLTDLAARARMTKQSMGELAHQLEALGYVTRVADPADGRAKLIVLTDRGRAATKAGSAALLAVESEWADEIGADRIAELRTTLEQIARPGG